MRSALLVLIAASATVNADPTTANPADEYLLAGDKGLVAQSVADVSQNRLLSTEPVYAAVHDETLDLVFFTSSKVTGIFVVDLRAVTPNATKLVDGVGGDFAITWFDGKTVTSNVEAINATLDFKAGTIGSTRFPTKPLSKEPWSASQRDRKRTTVARISVTEKRPRPLGKTGYVVWTTGSIAGLRNAKGRVAALQNPASWYATRYVKVHFDCAELRLDSTQRRWLVDGRACTTKACSEETDAGRVIGWVVPGPLVVPACGGGAK